LDVAEPLSSTVYEVQPAAEGADLLHPEKRLPGVEPA